MTTLCPRCVVKSAEERAKLRQRLHVDTTGDSDPFVFRLITMPIAFALSAVLISLMCIGCILMFAEAYNLSGVAVLLAITAGASLLLAASAWFCAWLVVREHEDGLARRTLLCPPLLYQTIVKALRSGPDDALWRDVHISFTAHVVGLFLFVSTLALAWVVGVDLLSAASYFLVPK